LYTWIVFNRFLPQFRPLPPILKDVRRERKEEIMKRKKDGTTVKRNTREKVFE
jgi:hypothetical protein